MVNAAKQIFPAVLYSEMTNDLKMYLRSVMNMKHLFCVVSVNKHCFRYPAYLHNKMLSCAVTNIFSGGFRIFLGRQPSGVGGGVQFY